MKEGKTRASRAQPAEHFRSVTVEPGLVCLAPTARCAAGPASSQQPPAPSPQRRSDFPSFSHLSPSSRRAENLPAFLFLHHSAPHFSSAWLPLQPLAPRRLRPRIVLDYHCKCSEATDQASLPCEATRSAARGAAATSLLSYLPLLIPSACCPTPGDRRAPPLTGRIFLLRHRASVSTSRPAKRLCTHADTEPASSSARLLSVSAQQQPSPRRLV